MPVGDLAQVPNSINPLLFILPTGEVAEQLIEVEANVTATCKPPVPTSFPASNTVEGHLHRAKSEAKTTYRYQELLSG